MNSSTYAGNPDAMIAGPPPPPPPPPPMSGQLPSMRINTTENAGTKKAQTVNNDGIYEPPAAIQNAMLTKDKKPFTYTPGMGGKLDLSQIRSPRMARRVAKNANDEGIEGPPKLAESKPSVAASTATNFLVQPQVAVPVFPSNVPAQPHVNRISSSQFINRTPSNAADKQTTEPPKNVIKIDTNKAVPITTVMNQSSTPESPSTPTQVTLVKAPTPWLQNKNKPQEELPEWAKRTCINKTAVLNNDSSESAPSPTVYVQVQQSVPHHSETKQKQEQEQHPTPQLYQQPKSQQQKQIAVSAMSQQTNPQSHQHERVIPIRIEDRPSVFDVKRDSGHHQFKQPPTLHHQQRWGQMPAQYTLENQAQNHPQNQEQICVAALPRPEQTVGTTYIIPVVVKDNDKKSVPCSAENNMTEKAARIMQQRNPNPIQQHEAGPVQSRSFRVLQKITDTDTVNDVGTEQIRRLELSEDERLLMNKFKEQVDHETYLHQEEDPRYRGAAIPSRAFRLLQNMTDSNDATVTCAAPRNIQNVSNKKQNRNSKVFEEMQANLPPSEQQVQEPKKYMGSAIPSRSFRILQAMTAPESNATQENRQADYTCRTENNLPGNQQGVLLPLQPIPFWYPEGWWGYYPVQYNATSNETANETNRHSFPFYAYPRYPIYPVYNENYTMTQLRVTDQENPSGQYGYAAVIYPPAGYNDIQPHSNYVDASKCNYHDRFIADDAFFARNDKLDCLQNGTINESKNSILPNEINHLNAQSNETYDPKNVSENSNRENNCISTAMNIIDEEDCISTNPDNITVVNNIDIAKKKTFGPFINVPNYTYIDTSDSSASSVESNDSSDSSDSISDNEQFLNSCQKNHSLSNDTTFNNTSSDSDSDSYIAYFTRMNPYEKIERDPHNFSSSKNRTDVVRAECSTVVNNLCGRSRDFSENCNRTGEEIDFREECIDYLDDRSDSRMTFQQALTSESERHNGENRSTDDRDTFDSYSYKSDRYLEQCSQEDDGPIATDDPPDIESTMVSVSLPLRFKFFISEDNEDITTVIVGDSKIKAEKSRDEYSMKNDVCVDFHVGNDTNVDFMIKTHLSDSDDATRDATRSVESAIPHAHVDFTLRKDPTGSICEGQNAEFTIAKMGHGYGINSAAKPESKDPDADVDADAISESIIATQDSLLNDENSDSTQDILLNKNPDSTQVESINNNNRISSITFDRMIGRPKLATFECSPSLMQDHFQFQNVTTIEDEKDRKNCAITIRDEHDKHDESVDLDFCQTQNVKCLSNVQDSREDTDDEDSGVTSDISRMISEADTDSECTLKNMKKYQRTQTHSRLFRLLNDDSTLSGYSLRTNLSRKENLSLPLETTAFNYDDTYCSNYSSGLTSPEYSPIHEQSWRRFHQDATTNANHSADLTNVETDHLASQQEDEISSKTDPYFRTWKSSKLANLREHDVVPSLAFKTLSSKIPSWTYKVNVLCPRIKSTKSVPQTLLARHDDGTNDPPRMVPSIPTSCTNSKTNYC
ncbi:putative mediator of RNA polymerase II transcription subunit 26 [Nylanderia fulva]|uniref:putative mediator of RNA polymerase II transcription subunit 26 n=1 Tax=Nylanderia fulva TaxID=613905 RepID=UPI0010FB50A4|nr:putative mediator of RNA polymerase II transcription subunit 26 [Nylanderia fulva]